MKNEKDQADATIAALKKALEKIKSLESELATCKEAMKLNKDPNAISAMLTAMLMPKPQPPSQLQRRDYFAAVAFNALLLANKSTPPYHSYSTIAKDSLLAANAMLSELDK